MANNSEKIILHLCADIGSDSKPYRDAGYTVICGGFFNIPKKCPTENYSKDYTHTIGQNRKHLKKFDHLLTEEIHPEYYGKLTRQERRSVCSDKFARAFFRANR